MRHLLLAVTGLALLIGGCTSYESSSYPSAIKPLVEQYARAGCDAQPYFSRTPECNGIRRQMQETYDAHHAGGGKGGPAFNYVIIMNK